MQLNLLRESALLIGLLVGFIANESYALVPTYGEFSVYTTQNIGGGSGGTIGSSTGPYTSDFEGIAAAGGSVYLQYYSINTIGGQTGPVSLFVGNTVYLNSGQVNNGGVEAGGTVTTINNSILGNTGQVGVNGGGQLTGSGGSIRGNVTLFGHNSSSTTINGTLTEDTHTYTPTLNLSQASAYFQHTSADYASLPQSSWLTVSNAYGTLNVSGLKPGLNIVDSIGPGPDPLTLANESALYSATFSGASNAIVVFNITGTGGGSTLKGLTVSGLPLNDILFNINSSASFSMGSSATYFSVLAPNSNITFTNGQLDGNLIAKNLYGSGQVDIGPGLFRGWPASAPEPSTYLLLASFLGILLGLRMCSGSTTLC